jgi:hypothetical protein
MTQYEEVGGQTDRMWNDKSLAVNATIEGRYIEKREHIGPNDSNVYLLETNDGEKVGVWGSTVIDAKFQNIAKGKMVKIKYLGPQVGASGKQFKGYQFWQGIMTAEDEGKVYEHAKSKPKPQDTEDGVDDEPFESEVSHDDDEEDEVPF